MKKKFAAIKNILFGKYVVIRRDGVELIVDNNMSLEELRKASCLFFKEAHSLT